jgi:hypothetical protein
MAKKDEEMAQRSQQRMAIGQDQAAEASMDNMIKKLDDANTVEEILGSAVVHAADIVGVELVIEGVRFYEGNFTDSLGDKDFAVMDCVRKDTNELIAVSTGSATVKAQLAALYRISAFPVVAIITSGDTELPDGNMGKWYRLTQANATIEVG